MNKNIVLLPIFGVFFSVFIPNFAYGKAEKDALDNFIVRAREMQLAQSPAWLNLLHYKSTLIGGYESQVDDPSFFFAEKGAYNAQDELEATLRGFFSYKASAHPRCMFPARFYWLNKQLGLSEALPEMDCASFNEWKDNINAKQITLLFPGMHMDSPASMFGHTSLRFDQLGKNQLLSYSLSYAASYDESDSVVVYSWKGVTGGYPGKFFLEPYYETLHGYSDVEQRDIWEYKLNLTQAEVDQLLRHYWEVRNTYFEYYFFRENCSFRLLALLDVAKEGMKMSLDAHQLYAIPIDTVRDIEAAGLVESRFYRPSAYNKTLQMTDQVGDEAAQSAIDIAKKEQPVSVMTQHFSIEKQAQILQLADEYLKQDKTTSIEKSDLQIDILSARSHLAVEPEEFEFKATKPVAAHPSARWQFSGGNFKSRDLASNQSESEPFYEIGLRPAFHDLLDMPAGFTKGSTIVVLDTQLRWLPQQEKIKLNTLNFFSMQSIAPVKPWVTPVSKQISFILKQRNISADKQVTAFDMQYSMGFATEVSDVLMYGMAKTQFEYAKSLKDNHGLYLGLETGLLWDFDGSFLSGQMTFDYQVLAQITGEPGDINKLNFGLQFNLFEHHALRLEYEMFEYETFETNEAKLSYLIYF